VGEALDVFYSFYDKRPLQTTGKEVDTKEEEFEEIIVVPTRIESEYKD